MSVRELINRNSKYAIVLVAILVLVAGFSVFRQISGGSSGGAISAAMYTTDEKTWFSDDPRKLTPFDKDGKEAVRAHVFKCENGTTFIGYMERYTPAAKALMEKVKADPNGLSNAEKGQYMSLSVTGKEIKRPGDAKWSRSSGAPMNVKCPDGKPASEAKG